MLYIFGGLPGTGKSELAVHLAAKVGAVYLRIDTIEQAMRDGGQTVDGPQGYMVAYKVAVDNLRLDLAVVADSVNPLDITRRAWRTVATQVGAAYREIEVICSDQGEHRRRVEGRQSAVPGLTLPTWAEVEAREYHPWQTAHIVIDTAAQTPTESKRTLERLLEL